MAKFSEVFSTTFKVIAALVIISAVAGIVYAIINHVNDSAKESTQTRELFKEESKKQDERITKADARHSSMPLSKWNEMVTAGIKQHCAFEGMNKTDVEKALGKPVEASHNYDNTDSWRYTFEDQKKCLKYNGDKCAEHPKSDGTVYLTPAGYVYLGNTGPGCSDGPLLWMLQLNNQ
jgi:hypothetical protein